MYDSKKICLWSGPRNISTALMYSFAQRCDTTVFDEPLYAYYLANSKAKEYHPGADEVMQSQNQNGEEVIRDMMEFNERPIGFFKHMTHHLLNLDRSFLRQTLNVILTREPAAMIHSFSKVIPNPKLDDLGYKQHAQLVTDLKGLRLEPIVVNSQTILNDPAAALIKLCERLGIGFDESMLQWTPGARPEDGVWARYWYKNVHNSSGFKPKSSLYTSLPPSQSELNEKCMPYYHELLQYEF